MDISGGSILSNEILSWMNVLLRLKIAREELYVGISRKICDILFVKGCCSVQTCTQEVKPFVEAYVLTNRTTFESDWAQTKYSNHVLCAQDWGKANQRFHFIHGKFVC